MAHKLTFIVAIALFMFAEVACGQIKKAENPDIIVANVANSNSEQINNLRKAAVEFNEAIKKGEYEKFADFTLPEVIEKSGGRKNFLSITKHSFDVTIKGFESVSLQLGEPGRLVELENKLFGIVPFRIEGIIKENKNYVVSQSSMVGISADNGSTWKFVSDNSFDEFFPQLVSKIGVPKERIIVNGKEQ